MNGARSLSIGQQAMWLLWKLAPHSAAYNVVLALRVRGRLDRDALGRAVVAVAARHDLLRSTFTEIDGVPHRVVGNPNLVQLDIRELGPITDEQLHDRAAAVAAEPFALGDRPPLRAVLLSLGPADAVLVLVAHHIASDATSQWLLARDLLRHYADQTDRAPVESYDTYVEDERLLLASSARVDLEAYWRGVCAGASAAELPTSRPRPVRRTLTGSSCAVRFSAQTAGRLRDAAAEAGVTPFAYLAGTFQALVHRHTGESDFLIGCPTTVRHRRGLREVVGYLANSIVLRATFDRSTTLREAILAANRATLQGMSRARYPFELLSGSQPLFRLAFTLLATDRLDPPLPMVEPGAWEGREIEHAGLRLALVDLPQMEGQFDILVEVRQGRSELSAVFKFDTDVFDRPAVERIAEQFRRLVEIAVDNPDRPVSQISLIDAADLRQLLAMGVGAGAEADT